ncbi:hypothetical protein D3C86_2176310 [compost metagenome]
MHCDAADLDVLGLFDEAQCADHIAFGDGDIVGRGEVVAVEFLLLGHFLFPDEDLLAQGEGGVGEG